MRTIPSSITVLLIVLCCTLVVAQESTYTISFCARNATVPIAIPNKGVRGALSPGHAFVVWAIDDAERGLCATEAFGFNPKSSLAALVLVPFRKPVAGVIFDEYIRNPGKGYSVLTVRVSKADYDATQRIRGQWSGKEYSPTNQDCVTFADTIARRIGLDTPDRPPLFQGILDNFPQVYMNKLKELNKNKGTQVQGVAAPHLSTADPKQQDEATKIQETLSDLLRMYTTISARLANEHKSINEENTYLEQERERLFNAKDKKSKDDPVRAAEKTLQKEENAFEAWKRQQMKSIDDEQRKIELDEKSGRAAFDKGLAELAARRCPDGNPYEGCSVHKAWRTAWEKDRTMVTNSFTTQSNAITVRKNNLEEQGKRYSKEKRFREDRLRTLQDDSQRFVERIANDRVTLEAAEDSFLERLKNFTKEAKELKAIEGRIQVQYARLQELQTKK